MASVLPFSSLPPIFAMLPNIDADDKTHYMRCCSMHSNINFNSKLFDT